MTGGDLDRHRRVLFTMLTVLDFRCAPGPEPPLIRALRTWLHGWPGIGRIVAGGSGWFFRLTHVPVQDGHDFGHGPDVIRDARLHGRGDPE